MARGSGRLLAAWPVPPGQGRGAAATGPGGPGTQRCPEGGGSLPEAQGRRRQPPSRPDSPAEEVPKGGLTDHEGPVLNPGGHTGGGLHHLRAGGSRLALRRLALAKTA